jgi:hypothetical protein
MGVLRGINTHKQQGFSKLFGTPIYITLDMSYVKYKSNYTSTPEE